MREYLYRFAELLPVFALAAFGGIARTIVGRKSGERYNFFLAFGEVVVAVFAGIVVHYITLNLDIPVNLKTAAIALAGYSARTLLTLLKKLIIERIEKWCNVAPKK